MKVVLLFVVLLLVPGMLDACPVTMGIHFEAEPPGARMYYPEPFIAFTAYIYIHRADCYVSAVEYQLQTPGDPSHASFFYSGVMYPERFSVELGDPFSGHSITYWPPLDGWVPGYNLLCWLECFTTEACWTGGGGLMNYEIVIGEHPDSGELRGTCWVQNDHVPFPICGLSSVLCSVIAVEEESWGAIKAILNE